MTIALVPGQTGGSTGSFSANTSTVTLPSNPTPGNLVVVTLSYGVAATVTVIDSNSNAYIPTTQTPFNGSSAQLGIFYLQNAPANATKTINITVGGAQTGFTLANIAEFSGAATTSVFESDAAQTFGGPSATINLPSITTTHAGDLLIGMTNSFDTLISANSPWTAISTAQNQTWAEYLVQGSAGAQAINFTQNSSTFWDGMEAAFKAGASAPPPALGWQSFDAVGRRRPSSISALDHPAMAAKPFPWVNRGWDFDGGPQRQTAKRDTALREGAEFTAPSAPAPPPLVADAIQALRAGSPMPRQRGAGMGGRTSFAAFQLLPAIADQQLALVGRRTRQAFVDSAPLPPLGTASFTSLDFSPLWQPPNPATANLALQNIRAAAIAHGDDGIESPVRGAVDGWEVSSVSLARLVRRIAVANDLIFGVSLPPVLVDQIGAVARRRFGQAFAIDHPWSSAALPLSFIALDFPLSWQPPNPNTGNLAKQNVRAAAAMRGDDGSEAPFNFVQQIIPWWQADSFQPTHIRRESWAAIARGDDGTEQVLLRWTNDGWEVQPSQPPHPRPERGGSLAGGDAGTEAPAQLAAALVWGHAFVDPTYRRPARRMMPDRDIGAYAPLIRWFNAGWQVQDFQPGHPRPERFGAVVFGDAGSEAPFVPPPIVPSTWGHPFQDLILVRSIWRAAAVMVGDGFFYFVPVPIPPPPPPPPIPVRPYFKPERLVAPTIYHVDTLVQMNVTFYNVQKHLPADPLQVLLFVQDPLGNIIELPSVDYPQSIIVKQSVGTYYCDFMPYMPGRWVYKWQGLVNGVVATSRDTPFMVVASDLIEN